MALELVEHRKARGAFFTPPAIADYLAAWPVGEDPDARVLDPTCGDGAFLPRLRRRLRSIAHRGHLGRVTLADIRRHTKEMGLTSTQFVKNNQLIVDEDNIAELLRILNEDLTRGGLTRDRFRIESKEPM